MPFRNPATHICTSALSLRSDDAGACAAERLEWERTSKPARAGEVAVRTKLSTMSGMERMRVAYLTGAWSCT